jgi:hypothetical protein
MLAYLSRLTVVDRPERDGDPICDLSHTTIYEQRVHLIVADGCGWGRKPRDAAVAAVTAFEARLKYAARVHSRLHPSAAFQSYAVPLSDFRSKDRHPRGEDSG